MNFHHNLRKNKKGIGTVFGMVFFLLIVMVVFASFVIILNQNTGLEQTTIQAKQLDLDRYSELQTVSIANPETAVLNNVVYILCDITNNGTLPTELVRLWIKDITNNTVGDVMLSPSLILQPGNSIEYFKSVPVFNASKTDQFSFWFVTTRGNLISAYPKINQFSSVSTVGASSGQNSGFANNTAPITLYVNPTKQNDLIYLAVAFDDGNTLNPPASTPTMNWATRITSDATDHYSHGDALLRTYYAFSPGGPINITLTVSGTENQDYYWAAVAFAISNVNVASPFDNSGPQTSIGSSSPAHDTIKISSPNELVIGAVEIDTLSPQITPGAGFTEVLPPQVTLGATGDPDAYPRSVWVETCVKSNPVTSMPVNCTYASPSRPWAIVLDAVNLVVTPPIVPVSFSPSNGPIGQPVTVSGGGFAANSRLIATVDGLQIPFSYTTNSSGNIPPNAIFTVPLGSTAGTKNVTIIDSKFNYASANFVVTTPRISASPQNGPVGTTVTIAGSNFITNSDITFNFEGNSITTIPAIITTTSIGDFSATFSVPVGTAGNKIFLSSDGVNSVNSVFTIIPSIIVSPSRGVTGTQVSISGRGFAAESTLHATFDGNPAGISGASITDATGSFSNLIITAQSPTLGIKSLDITDDSGNIGSGTFKLVNFDHFNMAVPTSVTAGQNFGSNNVIVTACDIDNYVFTNYVGQVYFSSSDSLAILPYTFTNMYTFTANDGGVHAFAGSDFTLKTAGSEILTITDGVKSNSITIVVNPAAQDHFTFDTINSPQVAGTGFSITITAKDSFENTVTSYTSAGTLSDLSGSITPTGTGSFINGVRTLTVTITKAYSDDTISILSGGRSGISNSFTVNPGAIHHFTFAGVPASAPAGQVFGGVVVTAYDVNNNVKTDYLGSVYFTSNDGAAVLPYISGSRYTFTSGSGLDNGVHSFDGFTLMTIGSRTITVTDGARSLTSGAIVVVSASVDHFAVTGFLDPVTAGAAGSVTVTAKDPYGNTVTTYVGTVHITSSDGAAVLPGSHALASGVYTFTSGVTLRTTGDQSITATDTATGLITGSQTGITVNPAGIASFTITGYPSSTNAGTSFGGVIVTAYDTYGNVKTDFTGQVYFTSTDGVATLPYTSGSRYTFVIGDQGVHTFSGFTLKTAGSRTITITDGTRSAVSNAIIVVTGALDHFTLVGIPASATAGSSFAGSVTITAYDAGNNVKTDYVGSIYFTSTDAQAVLPSTIGSQYTFLSSEMGTHTFAGSGFTLKTAPIQTITVRDDSALKSLTSGAITVNSAPLDHFTFSSISNAQVTGTGFSITITAKDVYENTVTSFVTAGTLSDLSGTITPTASGNFANGVRTVSVTITKTYSADTISVSASGKTGTSNSFTLSPGAIHHFTMTSIPASVTAGQVFGGVLVTAYDANNNVKTDYVGSAYFTSNDGAAVLPYIAGSMYTFTSGSGLDNGVHSFNGFTLKTVGSRTITVTDGSTSLTSSAITVGFAAVAHFAVTGFPNPAAAGTPGSVTVTAQDLYGNTVTSYVGTVSITSSDGAATLPANHALVSGTYTFTNGVTLRTRGTQLITATDTITGSLTGSQSGINVYNQVTFVSAGTADASEGTPNDPTPSYPTGLQANDLILLQVVVSGTAEAPTAPNGFTALPIGAADANGYREWIYYKFSTGSESGTLTVSVSGSVMSMAQMYAFRNVALSSFTEGGSFGSGSDATIEGRSVTTTGVGRLAVSFVFVGNNNGVGNLAGASGGYSWAEVANGEFQFNGNADGTLELQTATMATAGTISNGVATLSGGSDNWGIRAFALIPV